MRTNQEIWKTWGVWKRCSYMHCIVGHFPKGSGIKGQSMFAQKVIALALRFCIFPSRRMIGSVNRGIKPSLRRDIKNIRFRSLNVPSLQTLLAMSNPVQSFKRPFQPSTSCRFGLPASAKHYTQHTQVSTPVPALLFKKPYRRGINCHVAFPIPIMI